MRFVARIRPLLALLLCFGSVLTAAPAGAESPQSSIERDAPNVPAPESQSGPEAPRVGDDSAESEPELDARRRPCELNLGPASVALAKTFQLESLRLRKEDRRSCRPPNC